MNLQIKYNQDKDGVKYAPITVPQAVRWSNGDDLDDKLGEKADKVDNPTSGNFAALDANGNIVDSGHKHSDYLTQHQSLANYIQKSSTSGLVKNDGTIDTNTYLTQHQDISGKEDKVDIVSVSGSTLIAEVGKYYTFSSVDTLAITLPTIVADTTKFQTVAFYIKTGVFPAITLTSTHAIIYPKDYAIKGLSLYEICAAWNGTEWVIGQIELYYIIPTINIITKSTGGGDATITVTDVNNEIVTDILYTEVNKNKYWENDVVKVQYSPTGYSGWCVFAKVNVFFDDVAVSAGSLIESWDYSKLVDFNIYY